MNVVRKVDHNMKFFKLFSIIVILVGLATPPVALHAVESTVVFAIVGPAEAVRTDSTFTVTLEVSATSDAINTIEGNIIYPDNVLTLSSVNDGSSVVNFWVERPTVKAANIHFSGIMPGGFYGEHGRVLSLQFRAKRPGQGTIDLRGGAALKNDGTGTPAEISVSPLTVEISDAGITEGQKEADTTPPETFTIDVTRDPSLFDDQLVAIFSTQDKQSGLDRYEVQENNGSFVRAVSPHLLHISSPESVTIRAYDQAGNVQETTWRSTKAGPPLVASVVRGILKGVVIVILALAFILILLHVAKKFLW